MNQFLAQGRTNRQHARVSARRKPAVYAGFTLVELLAVITLIAMLMGILLGAAQYVVKTSRQRRAEGTAAALKVAITSYRHEYGKWPISTGMATNITGSGSGDGSSFTANGAGNYQIFDMLRATTNNSKSNPDNPKDIRFIDDSTVFSVDSSGKRTPRYLLPPDSGMVEAGHPIVYMTRDGNTAYFNVCIMIEMETADVTCPVQ